MIMNIIRYVITFIVGAWMGYFIATIMAINHDAEIQAAYYDHRDDDSGEE